MGSVLLVVALFAWLSVHYITNDSYQSLKREAALLLETDEDGRITVKQLHRVQLADDLVVECIEGLGTGDGDDSHRPFCGVLYKFHLKASLSQVGHQTQVPCA